MNQPLLKESVPASQKILLEALESRWKQYRVELKRCRSEFSNEAVHDLRVATRRMLALIQMLHSITPRQRLEKLSRAFKGQLDEFDDLRDTQVILAELSEILQEFPQLQDFQKHLRFAEEKMLRVLRKKTKKMEMSEVTRRVRKTHESFGAENLQNLGLQVLQAVDDAYLLAKQRLVWVDPARSTTIHRVRILFKNFRYMVEIVHPLLKDFPPGNLKLMHDYQSLMGEVQDAEVFAQTLTDFSEYAAFPFLEPVRRYYEERHSDATSAYVQAMRLLDDFWRPAPDQAFPWEKATETLSDPPQ
jgi:CHAD domain-containing protein